MDHARAAISNLVRHSPPVPFVSWWAHDTAEERFKNVHVSIREDDESKAVLGATVWVVSQMSLQLAGHDKVVA